MADPGAARHPVAGVAAPRRAREHAVEVERQRPHLQLAVLVAPLLARAVAVDLDPVALRIVEVERLGDEVVGGAGEPVPGAVTRCSDRASSARDGHEEREVEEARRARRARRRIGPSDERDERGIVARRSELDGVAVAADLAQTDRVAVERRPVRRGRRR